MKRNLKIEFEGSVLFVQVNLEGRPISLASDGKDKWGREIKDFLIEGKLDVFMHCTGFNGTSWRFEIFENGTSLKKYSGAVRKGFSQVSDSI